mmetsp:Transcript_20902/g.43946  ORF Transcript_20902/g.43946 Transcript_20902/m.43946 type:complete len:238 (+) Transcript_20902:228-941(+)
MSSITLAILLISAIIFTSVVISDAFARPSFQDQLILASQTQNYAHLNPITAKSKSKTLLRLSNFMDYIGKFFEDFGKDNNEESGQKNNNFSGDESDREDEDGEAVYTGSTRIISIPAKTMKTGGLRLYCSLYLMGLQNTPEPKCWKAHQSDNFEVNLRYCDLTGSIIIQFTDDGIDIFRLGSSPSMKYLMHESMILNGFLDELHAIVYEGDVIDENRLLTLQEPNDIEKAREVVSFA